MTRRLISVTTEQRPQAVEAIERKGIGHPDSLADLVADEFSRLYSIDCMNRWGVVLNHWVDKVNLVGSAANVSFGGFDIVKPVTAHLFGKVSSGIGRDILDLERLFHEAVSSTLQNSLGSTSIGEHMRLNLENTAAPVTADHLRGFYHPASVADAVTSHQRDTRANDTVICAAYSTRDDLAFLARELEGVITDPKIGLAAQCPQVGTDVKVVLIRHFENLEVTVCVPGHADRLVSRSQYDELVQRAKILIEGAAEKAASQRSLRLVSLVVNSKDTEELAYICPFGTSLGKGDCGVVGRGNRLNGVIDVLRPCTSEAPAGKNPLHHVGKLYAIGAQIIANECLARFGATTSEVLLTTDNGRPLESPKFIMVTLTGADVSERDVMLVSDDVLAALPNLWRRFLTIDSCARFRDGGIKSLAEILT